MHRRQFLHASALGVAGGLLASDARPLDAIDAHTHFYDPTRKGGVPWPDPKDRVLYRKVMPDELARVAGKHGVTSTIVVEASPLVEDNQWLLDLAAREKFIVGVVGRLDPAADGFAGHLKRFAKDDLFRGIRVGHAELKKGLDRKAYLDNLRLLAKSGRQLDVNGGPDMPADVARLAKLVPDLRVVINHAANLRIDGKAPPDAWRRGMDAAAAHKTVWCKVSALVEATGSTKRDAPGDGKFYRPVLDALWEAFGADRLIYGSNWPVSDRAASYAALFGVVRSYFDGKGAAAKFFRRNAEAAYRPVKR